MAAQIGKALDGKVAVVTGASSGIGAASARLFAEAGARVVVVSGNHDNALRFEAVRPVFASLDVTVMGLPRRRGDGGVIELECADGVGVRIALVPFCSQRSIIRTAQLMQLDAAQLAQTYDERMRRLIAHLVEDLPDDAVNVVAAHQRAVAPHPKPGRVGN